MQQGACVTGHELHQHVAQTQAQEHQGRINSEHHQQNNRDQYDSSDNKVRCMHVFYYSMSGKPLIPRAPTAGTPLMLYYRGRTGTATMKTLPKLVKSSKPKIISAVIIITGVAAFGIYWISSSHAQSPYTAAYAANGSLSGSAKLIAGGSNASGQAVQFGGSSSLAPMQLLNRLSSVKIYPASAASANGDYYTPWSPGSTTGAVEYDLSAVPAASRSKVLLAWSTANDQGYSPDMFMNGECAAGAGSSLPVNYTVDVNAAAGGTSPPTSGWVNAATVSNNVFYSRQNLVNMINPSTGTPYNWIRMNITSSTNTNIDLNLDLANASQGITSDYMFIGDSITTFFAGHVNYGSDNGSVGNNIADLVAQAMGSSYHIITQNTGVACTTSANWNSVYSAYDSNLTIQDALSNFPGNFVTLNLGTNDAYSGGGNPSSYYSTMQTLANDVIAAGKTPIIPDIPWPNNGDGTAWDNQVKAFNSEISQLIASNPKIIAGPNMYSVLQDHTNWFLAAGNVHPNDPGITAYRCAWAYDIAEHIYKTTPSPISACTPYVSP
jgi:lysophospholipase L1-like esterase